MLWPWRTNEGQTGQRLLRGYGTPIAATAARGQLGAASDAGVGRSSGGLSSLPPEGHVLDSADVLSRASTGELGSRLASLESDHINANLVTVKRLDYNVDLDSFAQLLTVGWFCR